MKSFYLIASTASFLFPTASCSNPTVHSGRPRRNSSHPQPGRAGMVVFPLGHLIEVRFVFLPLVSGSMARRLIRVCGAKVTLLSSFFYQPVYILPPPYGIKGTNFLTNWHARKPPKRASEAGFVPFLRRLSALRLMSVRSPRAARRAAEGRRPPLASPGLPPDRPLGGAASLRSALRAVLKRWKPAACERAEKHCGAGKKRPQRKIFFSADEIRFLRGASPSAPQCFSAASSDCRKALGISGLKNSENAAAATAEADSPRRGFLEARGAGVLREFA